MEVTVLGQIQASKLMWIWSSLQILILCLYRTWASVKWKCEAGFPARNTRQTSVHTGEPRRAEPRQTSVHTSEPRRAEPRQTSVHTGEPCIVESRTRKVTFCPVILHSDDSLLATPAVLFRFLSSSVMTKSTHDDIEATSLDLKSPPRLSCWLFCAILVWDIAEGTWPLNSACSRCCLCLYWWHVDCMTLQGDLVIKLLDHYAVWSTLSGLIAKLCLL